MRQYLSIILAFSAFPMVSYYMEVMVKIDGSPKLATAGVCAGAACNILLDYLFVIKFGWGIKGAAIASGMSQVISTVIFLVHFLGKKSNMKLCKFKFDIKNTFRSLSIGLSDFITEMSTGVIMTMIGVSQGMQPLVSYNYGKGDNKTFTYYYKLAVKTTIQEIPDSSIRS